MPVEPFFKTSFEPQFRTNLNIRKSLTNGAMSKESIQEAVDRLTEKYKDKPEILKRRLKSLGIKPK
jgi:hypothetical protein